MRQGYREMGQGANKAGKLTMLLSNDDKTSRNTDDEQAGVLSLWLRSPSNCKVATFVIGERPTFVQKFIHRPR